MHYNLLNECMSCRMSNTDPKVGMVATMFVGSDRYAMVVTEVFNNKKIKVTYIDHEDMNSIIVNENSSDYLPDNIMNKYASINDNRTGWEGVGSVYTYRKNKRWMPQGEGCWGTCSIHLGKAENYRDPNF